MIAALLASTSSQVSSGSLIASAPISLIAGLLSFLSPCVLPLVPGYLSYITGMSVADLADAKSIQTQRRVSRVVIGSVLFVLGFAAVFVSLGAAFGSLGSMLKQHQATVTKVIGVITILLGLVFTGLLERIRFTSFQYRPLRIPTTFGLIGAPLLGVMFGLGWTPCIGPTLSAVLGLAASTNQATAARGALLAFVYCLGLGIPFLIVGIAFQRSMAALGFIKRHYRAFMVLGGSLLILTGALEVTGLWATLISRLQTHLPGGTLL